MQHNKQTLQRNITIWSAIGLYALMVLGVVTSIVIPWVEILSRPDPTEPHLIIFMAVVVVSVILPVLLAYLFGTFLTQSKDRVLRRYNGVLLGFLAYWVLLVLSMVGSYSLFSIGSQGTSVLQTIVGNAWPIVLTVIITLAIATLYKKHASDESLVAYKPYQYLLIITSMVTWLGGPIYSQWAYAQFDPLSLFGSGMFAVVALVSFFVIPKQRSFLERLTLTFIVVTVAFGALYVTTQFIPIPGELIPTIIAGVASVAIWVAYLVTVRRTTK